MPPRPTAADAARALRAAQSAEARGNLAGALHFYRRILSHRPDDAVALARAGVVLGALGDVPAAAEHLERASLAKPADGEVWLALAMARIRLGRGQEAEAAARRSLDIAALDVRAWTVLGDALADQGRGEDAAAAYRHALRLDPGFLPALANAAIVRAQLGQTAAAASILERALGLAPDDVGLWRNLALLRADSGDAAGALAAAERVEALAQSTGEAAALRGEIAQRSGDAAGALAAFAEALARGPERPEIVAAMGSLLVRAGRGQEAATLLASAVERHPESAVLLYRYGESLEREGRNGAAADAFRQAMAADPDDAAGASLHLAVLTGCVPPRCPDAWVARAFDLFADRFEEHLRGLDYRVPEHLAAMVAQSFPERQPGTLAVLDVGCGTGLCGALLRPLAAQLDGVDLSPRMAAKAQARRTAGRPTYDSVTVGEAVSILATRGDRYDAIVAADVLMYLGDLGPSIAAAATALRPGGILCFNVESAGPGEAEICLRASHRFAHRHDHINACARGSGLLLDESVEAELRAEAGQPIAGWLMRLRRPTAAA